MQGRSTRRRPFGAGTEARRPRRPRRPRWCRVRIETDLGVYVGSLELGCVGLRELVDDERAYLGLWDATLEGTTITERFLALHKGAICSVVVVDDGPPAPLESQQV